MKKTAAETSGPVDLFAAYDVMERANEGVEMELVAPDGKHTDIWLRVLGRDADAAKEVFFDIQDGRFEKMQKAGGKMVIDSRTNDREQIELIAARVTSWSAGKAPWTGEIVLGGETVKPTMEHIISMFKRVPWAREAVEKFSDERANFLKWPSLH